jgi:hypothetical protein
MITTLIFDITRVTIVRNRILWFLYDLFRTQLIRALHIPTSILLGNTRYESMEMTKLLDLTSLSEWLTQFFQLTYMVLDSVFNYFMLLSFVISEKWSYTSELLVFVKLWIPLSYFHTFISFWIKLNSWFFRLIKGNTRESNNSYLSTWYSINTIITWVQLIKSKSLITPKTCFQIKPRLVT